jgi:hypothetical protein
MHPDSAAIPAESIVDSSSPPRAKTRLLTVESLDGRTIAARRARELAAAFQVELGGTVSATQRFAIGRAAALVALAEDAKARRLAGDDGVSLNDIVRLDGAAARAVKGLGIKPAPKRKLTLGQHLAARQAAAAGARQKPAGALSGDGR